MDAEEAAPAAASFEVTVLVVLVMRPTTVPSDFTFRLTVQVDTPATVAPVVVMRFPPAVAVDVPPQVDARPFGVATTRPAGNVSVKATPVSGSGFEFDTVSERLVVPREAIPAAAKALEITAGAGVGIGTKKTL